MLKSLRVENFRGFEELAVDELSRVNLIVGKNNVGKTALLEAVHLLTAVGDVAALRRVNEYRGLFVPVQRVRRKRGDSLMPTLVHGSDWRKQVRVEGNTSEGRAAQSGFTHRFQLELFQPTPDDEPQQQSFECQLEETEEVAAEVELPRVFGVDMSWERPGRVSVRARLIDAERDLSYPMRNVSRRGDGGAWTEPESILLPTMRLRGTDEVDRYSSLAKRGRKDELITGLQIVDDKIENVELLQVGDEPVMHVGRGTRQLMPIGLLGEGAQRLTSLVLAMTEAAGGYLLVDEIDTGLHHSVLPRMWSLVIEVARRLNVQVFATTHSYDCEVAAHESFKGEHADDLMVHRLERIDGAAQSKSFGHEILGVALESGFEVR